MIYTITPNPCLDLSGTVAHLIPDEKSYVHNEMRSAGGNAINAARIIQRLKAPVTASGFLGGGVGTEVASFLNHEKVHHEFIKIRGYTRINVTVANDHDHRQTRLSFPGPEISPKERASLFSYINKIDNNSFLLFGGSLPPAFTGGHLLKALKIARSRHIPTLVDVPGHLLKYAIASGALMIKPNLSEFQTLTGENVRSIKGVLKLIRDQKMTRAIPLICISSVEGGALLVTPRGSWHGRIPKIKIKTTVGAGDSMVGAMSAYLWKQGCGSGSARLFYQGSSHLPENLLRYGLAAACGTLSLPGVLLTSAKEIARYAPQIVIQSL